MENFLPVVLQATSMQVLESAYIIHNSSNIETVISRQEFLQEKYNDLLSNIKNPRYATNTEIALATYKSHYYDRPLQDIQLAILTNPLNFDLIEFFCDSLVNTLKRFYANQLEEVSQMKSTASKQKRMAKVFQSVQRVKKEITDKYITASGYRRALNEIDKLSINN